MMDSIHANSASPPAGASAVAPPSVDAWLFPGTAMVAIALALAGAQHLLLTGPGLAGLLILIVLLGVPHGAMDIVAAWRHGLLATVWRASGFHAAYVAIALLVYLLWQSNPLAGLVLFVACSAMHFRNDWRDTVRPSAAWIAGLGVVCWPVLFHPTAFAEACAMMGVANTKTLGYALALVGGAALLLAIPPIVLARHATLAWRLELACTMLLAALTHPLVFFAIYFCFLHGARDFRAQVEGVPEWRRLGRSVTLALIYTVLAAAAVIAVSALEPAAANLTADGERMRWVFVGLACLTVPHMLLHGWLARRSSSAE